MIIFCNGRGGGKEGGSGLISAIFLYARFRHTPTEEEDILYTVLYFHSGKKRAKAPFSLSFHAATAKRETQQRGERSGEKESVGMT